MFDPSEFDCIDEHEVEYEIELDPDWVLDKDLDEFIALVDDQGHSDLWSFDEDDIPF